MDVSNIPPASYLEPSLSKQGWGKTIRRDEIILDVNECNFGMKEWEKRIQNKNNVYSEMC